MGIGAVAGALLGSASSNGTATGAQSSAGPSMPGLFADSRMQNSGWVVSTGSSSAWGTSSPVDSGMSPSLTAAGAGGLATTPAVAAAAMGGGSFALSSTTLLLIAVFAYVALKK